MSTMIKDPDARLDFSVSWEAWLQDGETIVESEWLPDTGITMDSDSIAGGRTIVWLSGGTAGQRYAVTNRITTSAGRIDDRTLRISVRDR